MFARMALMLTLWVAPARDPTRVAARGSSTAGDGTARFSPSMFAVTFSIASVDWIMSLEPHWSSSIFAVYVFAGLLVSGIAGVTLIVILLRAPGRYATWCLTVICTISASCCSRSAPSGPTSGSRNTC